ncbi:MAG: ABC transporter substrate-binding protein [Dissulfurimicrobium sp.]|uniref:ABC transporter substrate-binding protein n=1 Tax=Dissulfurimicrobium sp. TaxID=2022436 RepID=UPI0040499F27
MAILRYVGILLILMFLASISWAGEVTYRDNMGRVRKIAIPVKRAVILMTHELIPALNTWDRVVGVSRWAYTHDGLLGATRPGWKDTVVPVGGGMGQDVNIEALLKLRPDVVITGSFYPETTRFMEQNGLSVISINPETLPELYDVINLEGRLFGREKEAEKIIDEMEEIFSLIRERVSKIPADKRRKVLWVYYGGKSTSVACKGSVVADMLERICAINPASVITQGWGGSAEVSIERIIAWNPDIIFLWGYAPIRAIDILNNPQWRYIKAVRDGRVYKASRLRSTWSPILAPLALWTAMKTYPEYFKDVDFEKVIDDFYRKVFGIPYSKVKGIED